MSKYIVDISRWQGKMNWARAANAGCVLGIARATMGLQSVNYPGYDEQFNNNWDGMAGEGVDRGAYHLFLPQYLGKDQADWFVSVVQDPPRWAVVDVELNKTGVTRTIFWDRLLAFCIAVDAVWPGTVIVYTANWFWPVHLGTVPFPYKKLMVAHYTTGPKPTVPKSWADWFLWQHSANGNKRGGEFGCESWDVDLSRANFRL